MTTEVVVDEGNKLDTGDDGEVVVPEEPNDNEFGATGGDKATL